MTVEKWSRSRRDKLYGQNVPGGCTSFVLEPNWPALLVIAHETSQ